jgi:hypothetical protein
MSKTALAGLMLMFAGAVLVGLDELVVWAVAAALAGAVLLGVGAPAKRAGALVAVAAATAVIIGATDSGETSLGHLLLLDIPPVLALFAAAGVGMGLRRTGLGPASAGPAHHH